MENKENMNVEEKKTSTKKVIKYAAFAAAAVGLGYILGNKETRDKIGSSINKLTAPRNREVVIGEEDDEFPCNSSNNEERQVENQNQRPRKEWRNKGWRQERQFNNNQQLN